MNLTRPIFVDDEMQSIHLHFNCRWAQRLGLVGVVWKDHIYFAWGPERVPAWVLAHEIVHVWQWRQVGWWRHLWRYIRALIKQGYVQCAYETEAIRFQNRVKTGLRVTLPRRTTVDYHRGDGYVTHSAVGTWDGSVEAPFLTTWDQEETGAPVWLTQPWYEELDDEPQPTIRLVDRPHPEAS
jgi:hypothetical protein